MRLTAGLKATVVRGLRRQARRFARAQNEARDRGLERSTVLPEKPIVPLHPAFTRLEDAEALILVDGARQYCRLLADHSFAHNLGVDSVADRIMDQPAPRQELSRHRADILDAHEIGEYVVALRWLRVIAEINRPHCDANPFGFAVEEASCGHATS